MEPETTGINTFREKSLHMALKAWYAQEGDRFEVEVDGCVIDLLRDDLLIEIQTGNFSSFKSKLIKLLKNHRVHVVYPIAQERWIVKLPKVGLSSRRRSPKKGHPTHMFRELVYIHPIIAHPNFSLEVAMVRDEEIRCDDGQGSWRRKGWSICDRRLLEVMETHVFTVPADFLTLLPVDLPELFTTSELAQGIRQPRAVAQKMAYTLRQMGLITVQEKRGNAFVYQINSG